LVLAWLGGSALAGAQNLLPNPDFDTDLSGWTVNGLVPYGAGWPSGVFTPGAARGLSDTIGEYKTVSACVDVTPSTTYLFGFHGYIPNSQTADGSLTTSIVRFGSPGCVDNMSASGLFGIDTPGSLWQSWSADITVDADTHSLQLSFRVGKTGGTGTFDGRIDGVYFGRHPKGDLDRDGRVDLVLDDLAGPAHQAWKMSRELRASAVTITPDAAGPDWKLSAMDDFDLAGNRRERDDLVFRNTATGAVDFWLMNGTSRTSLVPLSGAQPPAIEWQLAAAADFNQDAKPDLLWRNTVTQKLMVWTMNGTAYTGTITPTPDQAVDGNWACVATLDVNRDGATDLLWYNATTGKIVIWYMNASVVRITGKFAEPPNAGDNNWKVLAAGDYAVKASPNLDSVDLVWRNETSGKMVLWYMDTFFIRVAGGFTNPDSATPALGWTVAGPR
jgi:hypothetical protein